MRVFVAVDLGSEEVRRRIVEIQEVLTRSGADLKSVEPQNLHFTIRFLGEVGEREVEGIHGALKGVEGSQFKVSFKGLGYFPDSKHISVVWVGVDEGGEELIHLAEQVEERLKTLGFKPDKKFVPHLTICRVKSGRFKDQLLRAGEQFSGVHLGVDTVSSFKVKQSQLTPRGPIYTDILTVPLKADA